MRQGREELGMAQAVDATHDLATFFRSVGKLAKANSLSKQKKKRNTELQVITSNYRICQN